MSSLLRNPRLFYFLLGGVLLVHLLFMVVELKDHFYSQNPPQRPSAIKLKLVQESTKYQKKFSRKQIVQSEDTTSNEPKKDAFLSDKNRSFERQTMAKTIDSFKKAAQGNSQSNSTSEERKGAKKNAPHLKDLKLSDFGIASGGPMPQPQKAVGKKGMSNGDPLEQGLSATNDYVQEMQLGDFTHLNTIEYKHYGFFHRIRQKLEQFWGKSIREKSQAIFRSGRTIASQDYVTSLQVTLNDRGEIVGVKILGSSGVKELDDAALESFKQAGPFPNPPKDLLVNGIATIEWGFVVKS